ncbi:MAG: VWA domain-containing protein, partial [Bacteroidota bacterium]
MLSEEVFSFWDYLSWDWFLPSTLWSYDWGQYQYLYLLISIPLLFGLRYFINVNNRQSLETSLMAPHENPSPIIWLRFLPDIIFSFFILLVIIALARPQKANLVLERSSEGIDIMLILDISESMLLEDFRPNRLEASKKVAKNFVAGRSFDRIGLVIFSGEAYSLSPLTTDYALLQDVIQEIEPGQIDEGGTAIGSALGVGTNRLRESEAKSKVIILISDGDNTAGNLGPLTAAQLSAYYGIKIYTILVGREGRIRLRRPQNGRTFIDNSVDEGTLQEIAEIGEGTFFRAADNASLERIFEQINYFEKSEIIESRYKTTRDYYPIYLVW